MDKFTKKERLKFIVRGMNRGDLICTDIIARKYLNGEDVELNRGKAKYYFKQIASQGYQKIDFDNYGLLLILLGVLHYNDGEIKDATHCFINAYDFIHNYLPKEIGQQLIDEHELVDYINSCTC